MPPINGIYLREYQVPWAPTHGGVKQVKDSNSPSTCNEETSDNSEEEIEAQCHMAGSATDSEDSTPEPEDTESELEWDSEGNIPIKKALCEECDEVIIGSCSSAIDVKVYTTHHVSPLTGKKQRSWTTDINTEYVLDARQYSLLNVQKESTPKKEQLQNKRIREKVRASILRQTPLQSKSLTLRKEKKPRTTW